MGHPADDVTEDEAGSPNPGQALWSLHYQLVGSEGTKEDLQPGQARWSLHFHGTGGEEPERTSTKHRLDASSANPRGTVCSVLCVIWNTAGQPQVAAVAAPGCSKQAKVGQQ